MKIRSRLLELRALSAEEFDLLISLNKEQKDIAIQFGLAPSQVSKEVAQREVKKLMSTVDMRKEFQIVSTGAWTNSPERHSLAEAGLISNISLKYV
jgi:hypothetical protein